VKRFYGKTIADVELWERKLIVRFDDGDSFELIDKPQECCEERFLRTDDDLLSLIGCKLLGVHCKSAEIRYRHGSVEEVNFIELETDRGFAAIACYNIHNGFYGGIEPQIITKTGDAIHLYVGG